MKEVTVNDKTDWEGVLSLIGPHRLLLLLVTVVSFFDHIPLTRHFFLHRLTFPNTSLSFFLVLFLTLFLNIIFFSNINKHTSI